jgi:group I intron endonuclease
MKCGIYKITAVHNGKFYIGSSADIRVRWNRHNCDFRKNIHSNKLMQNIYNKYGKDSFVFEIVELIEKQFLIETEQKYIDKLNPDLNIRLIAETNLGLKHTDKAKAKMAKAKLGTKATAETKAKLSAIRKGKPIAKHTEEVAIANAKRQANFTDDQVWQMKWLNWLGLSSWEIARQFNVVNTTIYRIVNNKKRAYVHVDFNPAFPKLY